MIAGIKNGRRSPLFTRAYGVFLEGEYYETFVVAVHACVCECSNIHRLLFGCSRVRMAYSRPHLK